MQLEPNLHKDDHKVLIDDEVDDAARLAVTSVAVVVHQCNQIIELLDHDVGLLSESLASDVLIFVDSHSYMRTLQHGSIV